MLEFRRILFEMICSEREKLLQTITAFLSYREVSYIYFFSKTVSMHAKNVYNIQLMY